MSVLRMRRSVLLGQEGDYQIRGQMGKPLSKIAAAGAAERDVGLAPISGLYEKIGLGPMPQRGQGRR